MENCESRKPSKGESPSIKEAKDNLEKPEPGKSTSTRSTSRGKWYAVNLELPHEGGIAALD
ncbi:hypothetical protein LC605_13820 [Nostoc sp. CHAB 5836]|uniref:hypothetical protein n=1 Tax=Nostoc sp. CHAB 5836 TaxID=2780404 RepID=UPI001E61324B|nr:hypothetical protein [Nostoc sp. CHAB 5836]MCC5616124.1 hypothetical protein [Nostoc sp. CHAB 5836]